MPFVFIITHIVARLCLNVKWGERNAECTLFLPSRYKKYPDSHTEKREQSGYF